MIFIIRGRRGGILKSMGLYKMKGEFDNLKEASFIIELLIGRARKSPWIQTVSGTG